MGSKERWITKLKRLRWKTANGGDVLDDDTPFYLIAAVCNVFPFIREMCGWLSEGFSS